MSGSTSFTGSEWAEFVDSVGEDNAPRIANQIWNKERKAKLDEYKEFLDHCKGDCSEAQDVLDALYSLYTGNTQVYHELMERLTKMVYDLGYEPIVYETDLMYRGRP